MRQGLLIAVLLCSAPAFLPRIQCLGSSKCEAENANLKGDVLANATLPSLDACCSFCVNTTGCRGYTYCAESSGCNNGFGTSYPFQGCWLKSFQGAPDYWARGRAATTFLSGLRSDPSASPAAPSNTTNASNPAPALPPSILAAKNASSPSLPTLHGPDSSIHSGGGGGAAGAMLEGKATEIAEEPLAEPPVASANDLDPSDPLFAAFNPKPSGSASTLGAGVPAEEASPSPPPVPPPVPAAQPPAPPPAIPVVPIPAAPPAAPIPAAPAPAPAPLRGLPSLPQAKGPLIQPVTVAAAASNGSSTPTGTPSTVSSGLGPVTAPVPSGELKGLGDTTGPKRAQGAGQSGMGNGTGGQVKETAQDPTGLPSVAHSAAASTPQAQAQLQPPSPIPDAEPAASAGSLGFGPSGLITARPAMPSDTAILLVPGGPGSAADGGAGASSASAPAPSVVLAGTGTPQAAQAYAAGVQSGAIQSVVLDPADAAAATSAAATSSIPAPDSALPELQPQSFTITILLAPPDASKANASNPVPPSGASLPLAPLSDTSGAQYQDPWAIGDASSPDDPEDTEDYWGDAAARTSLLREALGPELASALQLHPEQARWVSSLASLGPTLRGTLVIADDGRLADYLAAPGSAGAGAGAGTGTGTLQPAQAAPTGPGLPGLSQTPVLVQPQLAVPSAGPAPMYAAPSLTANRAAIPGALPLGQPAYQAVGATTSPVPVYSDQPQATLVQAQPQPQPLGQPTAPVYGPAPASVPAFYSGTASVMPYSYASQAPDPGAAAAAAGATGPGVFVQGTGSPTTGLRPDLVSASAGETGPYAQASPSAPSTGPGGLSLGPGSTGPSLASPASVSVAPGPSAAPSVAPAPSPSGIEGVTGVEGDLVMVGGGLRLLRLGTGLKDLSSLASLQGVTGVLRLKSTALETLSLPAASSLGALVLESNLNLQSITLPPAATLPGPLILEGFNFRLASLAGIQPGPLVRGDLRIVGQTNLTSIDALSEVEQVQGSLEVSFSPRLLDLLGLRGLAAVYGDLIVEANDSLLTLNGLDNLQIVMGDVIIRGNRDLRHLLSLRNLYKIGGSLVLERNPSLKVLPPNLIALLRA